jgi:hypothetical protein
VVAQEEAGLLMVATAALPSIVQPHPAWPIGPGD